MQILRNFADFEEFGEELLNELIETVQQIYHKIKKVIHW